MNALCQRPLCQNEADAKVSIPVRDPWRIQGSDDGSVTLSGELDLCTGCRREYQQYRQSLLPDAPLTPLGELLRKR